jgi:curli biogenesis system outer membrane secretion channel CsgG
VKTLLAVLALASLVTLCACGVETAATAAAVAELKRREMEQAKKTMDMAKQKIEAATQQVQKSAERNDSESKE